MNLNRFKKCILSLLSVSLLANSTFATSFVDEHNDGSLSGWTVQGARKWQESNSFASAVAGSSNPGFLINSTTCGPNGTLEVKIKADQWSGYNGGVVFRWTSTSSFYFVAILPGNKSSSYIKLIKNSVDINNSSAKIVAQKFAMSRYYTLKIKMQGSTFQFFINDTLRGTATDASLLSGKVGYAYSKAWNTYIWFDRIKWTESTVTLPAAPTNLTATPVSQSQINLSWKDNASNETAYSIERATGSGAFCVIATVSANTTTFQSTGLTANTLYKFRVRASNSAGYSAYSPTQTAQTFGSVKFLIIVSSPLYRTGTISSDLAQYRQDINKAGWTNKLITVNKVQDQYADFICPTEVQLKNVIKEYYKNGLQGFIIVGSPLNIPTAYWRLYDRDTSADPTDLYYADMDEWTDLNNDRVYDSYHSEFIDGRWYADGNAANPNNPNLTPDLIYGRVSPDTTVKLLSDQAILVSKYFLKIHNHRVNGSNLIFDQQARSLFLVNCAYYVISEYWPLNTIELENATPHINMLTGYTLLFPERIKAELRKGFSYAQITSESKSDTLYTYSWKDEKKTPASFTLNDMKTLNAPIAQVNFVLAPYTARFTVPNFAATLILKTDYTLNVTGSTGSDVNWIDRTYYDDLNKGVPIGQAFKNNLSHNSSYATSLQGDPLLCYPRQLPNRAPMFVLNKHSHEATAGVLFSMDIAALDPEDDPFSITLTGLPEGARFDGTTLTWTPPVNLVETSDTIVAKVTDNHGNSTEQAFTLYVSHFKSGTLAFVTEGTEGWQSQGNGFITLGYLNNYNGYYNKTPYGVSELSGLATSNGWFNLRQSIQVKPNTRYRLSFWVNNQLKTNKTSAFVRVEELNQNITAPVATGEEFTYVKGTIYTGNRTTLTVSLNNGTSSSLTTGEVFFTLLRLVEGGN